MSIDTTLSELEEMRDITNETLKLFDDLLTRVKRISDDFPECEDAQTECSKIFEETKPYIKNLEKVRSILCSDIESGKYQDDDVE